MIGDIKEKVYIMKVTKEERFKELIDCLYTGDYPVKITLDGSFKRIEFYNSKGDWLFDYNQRNGYTWIRWSLIWSVFEKEYDMEYDEIELFMKDMLLTHLKIKETTPTITHPNHHYCC